MRHYVVFSVYILVRSILSVSLAGILSVVQMRRGAWWGWVVICRMVMRLGVLVRWRLCRQLSTLNPMPDHLAASNIDPAKGFLLYFPGAPRGKQRPRASTRNGRARMYTPKETVEAEATVASMAYQQAGQPMLDGPLVVDLHVAMPIPASWSQKKRAEANSGRLRPTGKPDADNISKLYLDALNGIVWIDDAQIVDLHVRKVYGDQPGVTMSVRQLVA